MERRVAFAAACAERQLPLYPRFRPFSGEGRIESLAAALQIGWGQASGVAVSTSEFTKELELCMSLIPAEGKISAPWTEAATYAQNAGKAVAHTIRAALRGKAQEACWAARTAYESLDRFVTNREKLDVNRTGAEHEIPSHRLIQAELIRQQRDLLDLVASTELESTVDALRRRARAEAPLFFAMKYRPQSGKNTGWKRLYDALLIKLDGLSSDAHKAAVLKEVQKWLVENRVGIGAKLWQDYGLEFEASADLSLYPIERSSLVPREELYHWRRVEPSSMGAVVMRVSDFFWEGITVDSEVPCPEVRRSFPKSALGQNVGADSPFVRFMFVGPNAGREKMARAKLPCSGNDRAAQRMGFVSQIACRARKRRS